MGVERNGASKRQETRTEKSKHNLNSRNLANYYPIKQWLTIENEITHFGNQIQETIDREEARNRWRYRGQKERAR